ncbi:dTDP-4-dehydrorhamnose reductase [Candidatus Margulisiibacteriota bacterium]
MTKILIIGADGQLGCDLCKVIPQAEQIPLTIKEIDITDRNKTAKVIRSYAPDIVINTAAYHNVDECEDSLERPFLVNTAGVKYLAEVCREIEAALVQISTDYVFDGDKGAPYVETDIPSPQSIYAISKLGGEYCVKYMLARYFIVRSTGLYGTAGCLGKGGGNFVENMLKRAASQAELKVVTDEVLSPTYTLDLAEKIYELVKTKHYGLYHLVNRGQCSWHEFTCEIFRLLKRKVVINKAQAADFPTKAKRPKFSVLKNANLAKIGLADMRPWQEALKAYLVEKGHLKSS